MTSVPSTAADYFGAMIGSYDSLIRRAVPRYEEMLDRLIHYLPDETSRILELGTGTGNLTLRLVKRFPHARIVTVDAAEEMLQVTRERLGESRHAVEFQHSTFEALLGFDSGFDLVTSSISLHHVADKQPLYETIFRALRPGGTFRFSDQLRGATEWNHQKNWNRWLEFCAEPGHCSSDETRSLLDHAAAHDHYTPLQKHFELLTSSGFVDPDCVWRNWIWGVVTADKKRD